MKKTAPRLSAKAADESQRPFSLSAALPFDREPLPADAIEVGRIGEAYGVRGWVRVLAHSAQPEALFSTKRWYVEWKDKAAGPTAPAQTLLLRVRDTKDQAAGIVAQFADCDDRNLAERLKGARIFVARSSFPTPDTDEFYWVDLVGCEVINREGVSFGHVKELLASAAQSTLVIEQAGEPPEPAGEPRAERLIPFVAAFVDTVDIKAKRITVDWQPDY